MGSKFYKITIFFGPHIPNFLETPFSLLLLFSELQQPPTCCSHAPDASSKFKFHCFFSTSNYYCVDLSPIQKYNFRWGPNFIELPFSLVPIFQIFQRYNFLCFCSFPICNNRLPVLRKYKTPPQNLGSISFCLPQINIASI